MLTLDLTSKCCNVPKQIHHLELLNQLKTFLGLTVAAFHVSHFDGLGFYQGTLPAKSSLLQRCFLLGRTSSWSSSR